jgi:hypothetical protein
MLLGWTYEAALEATRPYWDAHGPGITPTVVDRVLAEEGRATRTIYRHRSHRLTDLVHWPPAPIAPIGYAHVMVAASSPGSHLVVLLGDGRVLDPLISEPRRLSDYHRVYCVAGVYQVAEPLGDQHRQDAPPPAKEAAA